MDLRAGSGPSPPGRRRLALDIDRPGTAGTGASEAERGVLILYASPCPMLPIFASFMPIYRLKVWGFVGSPHEDGVESGRCRPHHLEKAPASVRSSGSGQPGPGGSGHGDASRAAAGRLIAALLGPLEPPPSAEEQTVARPCPEARVREPSPTATSAGGGSREGRLRRPRGARGKRGRLGRAVWWWFILLNFSFLLVLMDTISAAPAGAPCGHRRGAGCAQT